jgi:succinyl-CoA synthetase beta subunit
MNIHEYQGKSVLKQIGAPVSKGIAIFDASEAEAAAKELGGPYGWLNLKFMRVDEARVLL